MLKFLKIFPFLVLCFSSVKAQVDTFFLTNKKIYYGKIYKDYGDEFDIDCQNGPTIVSTKKLYKIVKANGSVLKYKDLTYLERGLSKENYRKILKPLTAGTGLFSPNLYYGGISISQRNFFDALEMIQDEEITRNIYRYKSKKTASHVLVPMGWAFQITGFFSIITLTDIHIRNGGIYYYNYESGIILYTCGAMMIAGFTEVVTGYIQAIVARKIKKRKLIDRYNSLILQP